MDTATRLGCSEITAFGFLTAVEIRRLSGSRLSIHSGDSESMVIWIEITSIGNRRLDGVGVWFDGARFSVAKVS